MGADMTEETPHPAPSIDFDLRQLEVFRKVVELGSFSRAAEAVFLAQASVSERIANLESMVGARLLDRLGRRVVPTKAGEILYKHSVLLLEMKETARMEMREFLGIRGGGIRMGGSTIPGEYILPGVLGRFREKHPFISVTLVISDTGEIERRVLDGELELGIVGSKTASKTAIVRELWKEELLVTVPSNHPWAHRREIPSSDLPREPFVFREAGSGTFRMIEGYLQAAGFTGLDALQRAAQLGSSTAVKEGIKAGLGISILSSRAVETEVKTGILRTLRIKGLRMMRSFYMIRDKRRIPSPPCDAMIRFLLSTVAGPSVDGN
jgi:DNA-binding transcriptional LysR family regulator